MFVEASVAPTSGVDEAIASLITPETVEVTYAVSRCSMLSGRGTITTNLEVVYISEYLIL